MAHEIVTTLTITWYVLEICLYTDVMLRIDMTYSGSSFESTETVISIPNHKGPARDRSWLGMEITDTIAESTE